MYRLLFCGALLALSIGSFGLAACNEERPAPDPDSTAAPQEDTAPAPGISLAEIVEAVRAGNGKSLIDRLGLPIHTEEKPVPNRHLPTQTDTLRTLGYDGLTLEVYDVAGPGGRLIDHLIVTGKRYATAEGLHVGSPRAAVEAALGPPDRREGDTYIYEHNDPVPTPLLIAFSGDTVSRLEWDFYVD